MTDITHPIKRNSGYAAYILRVAFTQWGARLGLIWICVLTVIAVFAPFFANSHPWLLSEKGNLSSHLLTHITAADVTLLVLFVTSILLLIKKPAMSIVIPVFTGVLVLTGVLTNIFISPPQLTTYEQYREKEEKNQ